MSDERFREIIGLLCRVSSASTKCARLAAALQETIENGGVKAERALELHMLNRARKDELRALFLENK